MVTVNIDIGSLYFGFVLGALITLILMLLIDK